MHIPTVHFRLPSITQEANTLAMFCRPRKTGWDSSPIIFARHPELEGMVEGIQDKKALVRACYKYAKAYRAKHAKQFERALETNKKGWVSIEKKYLRTLSEAFEIDYPKRRTKITAYVSMVPIYPRWLSAWSFNVSYFVPTRVREIACHEILHFMYFRKWLEVFPDTKYEELNSPHLVWRLSEIIDPVILSEHPYFKTLFDRKQKTYKQFQKLRIHNRQPATHLAMMYRRHVKSSAPFDQFLRDAFAFAQKHKRVLMNA